MNTLVSSLYKSRKFKGPGESFEYEGQVVDLVKELEKAAADKGLVVSRWQNNKQGYACTVTWAVHTGERPELSRNLPESSHVIAFSGLEGTTSRCVAYRGIRTLLEAIT